MTILIATAIIPVSQNVFANTPAPSGLTATPISSTQINLAWLTGGGSGAHTQDILRCTGVSCTPTVVLASTTGTATSYSDTTVVASTTYGYAIVGIHVGNVPPTTTTTTSYATTPAPSDTTAPVVTGSTINIVDGGNTELTLTDQYTEFCTATDETSPATPSCSVDSGSIDTNVLGLQSVTYHAFDTAGNEGFDTITTTVVDTTSPVIVDTSVVLGATTELTSSDTFTATCTVTDNDNTYSGSCTTSVDIDTSLLGSQTVTFSAPNDASGNIATGTTGQTTLIEDTTDPTFDVDGNTIDYNTNVLFNGVYTVGVIANQFDISGIASSVVSGDGAVDTSVVTSYPVTYTVTDNNGRTTVITETVIVGADTEKPVITPSGTSATIELESSNSYVELGAIVTDNDPNYSESVIISGDTVDTSTIGVYTVLYDAPNDASGNTPDQQSIIITVQDTTAPTFDVDGNTSDFVTIIEVTNPYTVGSILNIVELDTPISSIVGDGVVDTSSVATFFVTYTVTDASLNSFTITETVNVVDTTIPIITLIGSANEDVALNGSFVDAGATAFDIADGDITGSIIVGGDVVDETTLSVYVITYDVTDSQGNNAIQVTRTVTVTLGDAPVLTINGSSETIGWNAVYSTPTATCIDTEDGDISGNIIVTGGVGTIAGDYVIEYSCTDSSGNTVTDSIAVTRQKSGGGDSDYAWKTKPTFGKEWDGNMILVENGFSFNEVKYQITDNWHTPFEAVIVKTGETNTVTMKMYAPYELKWVEFLFGVPEVGKANEAQSSVYIPISWETNDIDTTNVRIDQKVNLIDEASINPVMSKVKCTDKDINSNCITITITPVFNESPKFDVMAIKAVDKKNRDTTTYLNEGVHVIGDSLNAPDEMFVASADRDHKGLVHITQIDRWNNIWTTDDGYIYQMNNAGTFVLISEAPIANSDDTGEPRTRTHSDFAALKDGEAQKAQGVFNAEKYVSTLGPSFTHEYPEEDSRTKFLKEHSMLEWARGQ